MPGRDVLFNLKVNADASALKDLKKFADECKKAQDGITQSAAANSRKEAKEKVDAATKAAKEIAKVYDNAAKASLKNDQAARKQAITEEIRESLKRDKMIADSYVKEHLRAIDAVRKQEQNAAKQFEKDRLEALKHVQAETRRAARESERDAGRQVRQEAVSRRNEARRDKRVEHAYGHVIGGLGEVARGAAYTGLVGQENSQTVLNTVAGVEGAGSLYRGGRGLAGALGSVATGGTATGGAALAAGGTVLAGLGAFVGAIAAATSAVLTLQQAAKHGIGGGADQGSIVDSVASREVQATTWLARKTKKMRGKDRSYGDQAVGGFFHWMSGGTDDAEEQLEAQQKSSQHDAEIRKNKAAQNAQIAGKISGLNNGQAETIEEAKRRYRDMAGLYNDVKGSGNEEASTAAAERVRAAQSDILRIIKEQQSTAVSTAKTQYDLLHAAADEAKRMHMEAKAAISGDLAKFAHASPEEKMRLQEIKRKQAAGENLSEEETATASGYASFQEFGQSNAERIAMQHGAGDIFGSAIADRDRLAGDAASAAKKAEAAKVELEQKIQVEIDFKKDPATGDKILAEFKPVMDQIMERIAKQDAAIIDTVKKEVSQMRNRTAL